MSKELDKKRCGANVEKVIIDEFVPSKELKYLDKLLEYKPLTLCERMVIETIKEKIQRLEAIENANPSEALESLERIDNTLCLNNIKGKLEFGIDTEEHIDCDSVIGMTEDLESIRQALLKAQEQKEMIVELCEYFGLDDLYPYDDLEKIESALKNARDVSTQQRMELLGKLNKQEKEDAEYKRVLDIIKNKCLYTDNLNWVATCGNYDMYKERMSERHNTARVKINWDDKFVLDCLKLLTQEEFDLLKRWIEK